MPDLNATDWIAIVSAIAAVLAWIEAARSRRIAQQALDRSNQLLDVYLVDSRLYHLTNETRRVYVFDLLCTNKSDTATSLKSVSLLLEFGSAEAPSNIAVPHRSDDAAVVNVPADSVLRVPLNLGPGESMTGSAIFGVSNALLGTAIVESYTVSIVDARGRHTQLHQALLKEIAR